MRLWFDLSLLASDHLVELARVAESEGYEGVTLSDHVASPAFGTSAYPYNADGNVIWSTDTPWPDVWVAFAALGTATATLRFATNIYVAPARNPFVFAKAAGTLAAMTNDRIVLGVGIGWMEVDYHLLGQPFTERGARLDELLDVVRALLTGRRVEYRGRFYDFPPVTVRPVPRRPIPVWIGGDSPAALHRAARYGDGWTGVGYPEAALPPHLERLAEARRATGRADATFDVVVTLTSPLDRDALGRVAAMGVTDVIVSPLLSETARPGWRADTAHLLPIAETRRAVEEFARALH